MMDVILLRKSLLSIFKQYQIEKAILFGSFARGESSSHSEVDLILIKKTHQCFFDRYDRILVDLNKALPDNELDVLIYTTEELEQIAERPFIAQAIKDGMVLYESN